MTVASVWPDRTLYSTVVQAPGHHFDDPELRTATFTRDRRGAVMAWSGGRAIVFRAELASGSTSAVRFMLTNDRQAGMRYAALDQHLSVHRVETLVRTRWIDDGLRVDAHRYPVMQMEWVDGEPIDRHIDRLIASPQAGEHLSALAAAWWRACRALAGAAVGHGDIHAGNTLVRSTDDGRCELRLVDYDSIWVPGLEATRQEDGHPAFQHPAREPGEQGPTMDAFPNTLTYLSLHALASDPLLWRFHDADDTLLFAPADLVGAPTRDLWPALLESPDSTVRAVAGLTQQWLAGDAERYPSLDHVIAAATDESATTGPVRGRNVWPPQAASEDRTRATTWQPPAASDERASEQAAAQVWQATSSTSEKEAAAARRTKVAVLVMVAAVLLIMVLTRL